MSRTQARDPDLSSEFSNTTPKGRCETCRNISTCNLCGSSISGFEHIGVRATAGQESGIWHYASPCRHRNQLRSTSANVKYNGGPLWKKGYIWQSIYWGPYFTSSSASTWVASVEDRKSTRLNSSHSQTSYAAFCLKKNSTTMEPAVVSIAVSDGTAILGARRRSVNSPAPGGETGEIGWPSATGCPAPPGPPPGASPGAAERAAAPV